MHYAGQNLAYRPRTRIAARIAVRDTVLDAIPIGPAAAERSGTTGPFNVRAEAVRGMAMGDFW